MKKTAALLALLLVLNMALAGENTVSKMFSDGMVLQRQMPVPVWGKAPAGTKVIISFEGQTKETAAGKDGKWMVKLDPLKTNAKGQTISIVVGDEKIIIKDVLIGEVWLCSGQSNMDFTLGGIIRGDARDPKDQPSLEFVKKQVETDTDPLLRQITFRKAVSPDKPLDVSTAGPWVSSSPKTNPSFTAVGYFFGKELRKELNVPVGLIKNAWGGTRVEPWIPAEAFDLYENILEKNKRDKSRFAEALKNYDPKLAQADYEKATAAWKAKMAEWETQAEAAKTTGEKIGPAPRKPRLQTAPDKSNTLSSTIYNAMIAPIVPYAIRGAIWYQGESNADIWNAPLYGNHMRALIQGWRKVWNQGDFPFYQVQLANFRDPGDQPQNANGWAILQNQQRLSLDLKNTGMAVINDIGEAKDIHPRNKYDVGKRLSLWALAKDYGVKLPAHSGPLYKSSQIKGNKILVTFDEIGSGLMVGKKVNVQPAVEAQEELAQFQIAGKDKAWKWAKAKIVGKDTVEVWCDEISEPAAVRYAWSNNPLGANLYNKEGLPASCFRTDNWPFSGTQNR